MIPLTLPEFRIYCIGLLILGALLLLMDWIYRRRNPVVV
jgi:hypothetical protein